MRSASKGTDNRFASLISIDLANFVLFSFCRFKHSTELFSRAFQRNKMKMSENSINLWNLWHEKANMRDDQLKRSSTPFASDRLTCEQTRIVCWRTLYAIVCDARCSCGMKITRESLCWHECIKLSFQLLNNEKNSRTFQTKVNHFCLAAKQTDASRRSTQRKRKKETMRTDESNALSVFIVSRRAKFWLWEFLWRRFDCMKMFSHSFFSKSTFDVTLIIGLKVTSVPLLVSTREPRESGNNRNWSVADRKIIECAKFFRK